MVELYVYLIKNGDRTLDSIKDPKIKEAVVKRLKEIGYL